MLFPVLLGLAVAIAAALVIGPGPYLAVDSPYPGPSALAVEEFAQVAASLAGALCLGGLVFALCCTRSTTPPASQSATETRRTGVAQMRLGPRGYAGLRTAERSSLVWAASALVAVIATATAEAGQGPWRLLSVDSPLNTLSSLVSAYERPGAWLVVAVLAGCVAVASRFCLSWTSCALMALAAALAVIAPWVVENAGEGPGHDYATGAAVWTSVGLSVLFGLSRQFRGAWAEDRAVAEARARRICVIALVAVTVGGAVLGFLLVPAPAPHGAGVSIADGLATWYGRLGLASAALVALAGFGVWRKRFQLVAIATGLCLTVAEAMSIQPAPAFFGQTFTVSELLLGFDFPGPPTLWRLLTAWRFDLVFGVLAVLAGALYVAGARRLRRRGDEWSVWRTVAFLVGCVFLLFLTSSGLNRYGSGQFSYHMMVHMGLNMFAPVLLVLGAPVTLLLRAVPPAGGEMTGPREWVLAIVHSRLVQGLGNPLVAIGLFVVSLYGLYFTPLFGQLVRYHWGHLLMTAHFLVVGYTYYWAIIGVDPGARRLPHLAKLGMLFAVMPFHAFFGVAVLSSDEIIGGTFYRWLALPWAADLAADQRVAGAVAWTSGEIPIVLVVGVLLYQWAKADRREATRSDRRADDDEDSERQAYNQMLEKLSQRRG